MGLPFYLKEKLAAVEINTVDDLLDRGYLRAFQYLRDLYPSLSYTTLFDLYASYMGKPRDNLDKKVQTRLINEYKTSLPHYAPLPLAMLHEFLAQAKLAADKAATCHEIPIGAVVVKDGQVIGRGYNQTLTNQDILQHAEVVALKAATQILGTHRLHGCDLYVTLEPCAMCVGAIIHSRIKRLVFAALSPDNGAVISQYQLLANPVVNKHTEAIGPVMGEEKSAVLQQFLQRKRTTARPF